MIALSMLLLVPPEPQGRSGHPEPGDTRHSASPTSESTAIVELAHAYLQNHDLEAVSESLDAPETGFPN